MKKIYSFDLFDTLVTRGLNNPKDVFTLVESIKNVNYRVFFLKAFSYREIRIFSEKLARFLSRKRREDINIYDIYKIVSLFIRNSNELLELELKLELDISLPKSENIKILNQIKGKGDFLCITSDMYLPVEVIKKILKKNRIYVNKIYVSSEIGLTKSSGNLFNFIANDLQVNLNQIVHYGDNLDSDVRIPKSLGCEVVHVGSPYQRHSHGLMDCFQSPNQEDVYYKIGYEFCGKLAYVFACYINDNLKDSDLNIVFGARDSYLFKFAFDLFFNESSNFNTFYTRISRSLVYLPEVFLTGNYSRLFFETMLCDEFFKRIKLSCPSSLKEKSVWKYKKEIENYLNNSSEFKEILENEVNNVKEYLKVNGFNNDLVFVDLGWKGSIQDSLSLIFKNELSIKGLYLGALNNKNKKGFIFDSKKPYREYFYIVQCMAVFEYFFTEPEKSLSTVKMENGDYKYIYTEDENFIQIQNREKIKDGAERFLLDFHSLNKEISFRKSDINNSLKSLIYYNTMVVQDEAVFSFLNLSHSIGFNGSLSSQMIEYSDLSLRGYVTAPWKAYFMFELKKKSKIKYYIFLIFFHNVVFFVIYEYIKALYRRIRAFIYG